MSPQRKRFAFPLLVLLIGISLAVAWLVVLLRPALLTGPYEMLLLLATFFSLPLIVILSVITRDFYTREEQPRGFEVLQTKLPEDRELDSK